MELAAQKVARMLYEDGHSYAAIADAMNRWGIPRMARRGVAKCWCNNSAKTVVVSGATGLTKRCDMAIRQNTAMRWAVTMHWEGTAYHLGTFVSRLDAAEHYDACRRLAADGVTKFPKHPRAWKYDPRAARDANVRAEVVSQYKSGKPLSEVAALVGFSVTGVLDVLKAEGVERRKRSEWSNRKKGPPDAALAPPRPEQAFTPIGLPPDGDGPVIAR
jgi:hypothetical protein